MRNDVYDYTATGQVAKNTDFGNIKGLAIAHKLNLITRFDYPIHDTNLEDNPTVSIVN